LRRPEASTPGDVNIEAGKTPLSAVPVRRSRLDLRNFERHQIQLKAGFDF
jgi:hypothetical protein